MTQLSVLSISENQLSTSVKVVPPLVCVKCIYDDHNGHHLMQIEEMSGSLLQNINDLEKMLNNTKRLIVENENLIEQVKEELSRLMDQQVKT